MDENMDSEETEIWTMYCIIVLREQNGTHWHFTWHLLRFVEFVENGTYQVLITYSFSFVLFFFSYCPTPVLPIPGQEVSADGTVVMEVTAQDHNLHSHCQCTQIERL